MALHGDGEKEVYRKQMALHGNGKNGVYRKQMMVLSPKLLGTRYALSGRRYKKGCKRGKALEFVDQKPSEESWTIWWYLED